MKKFAPAVIVLLAAAATLSACSKENSKNPETNKTGACAPVTGKPKITYITQDITNGYFKPISDALADNASKLGYDYNFVGPSSNDPTAQVAFVDTAIQNKVNAIAISPNATDSLTASLKRAMNACIKVLSVNSDIATGAANGDILPADFTVVGAELIETLGAQMNYTGEFAILSAAQDAVGQNQWIATIKEKLSSDAKYKNMKLVDTVYGDDKADISATKMQGLLTKYPKLAGVISPTAAGLPAAAKVLSQSPRKGKVALTGLALPNSMKPYVKDGTVTKFHLWDPALQGGVAAQLILDLLSGKISIDRGALIPPGTTVAANGKTYTADAKSFITAGALVGFDKSNIDQYDF